MNPFARRSERRRAFGLSTFMRRLTPEKSRASIALWSPRDVVASVAILAGDGFAGPLSEIPPVPAVPNLASDVAPGTPAGGSANGETGPIIATVPAPGAAADSSGA